jgi:hypothetical protein
MLSKKVNTHARTLARTLARSHARSDRTNKGAWEPKNHEGRLGEHGL